MEELLYKVSVVSEPDNPLVFSVVNGRAKFNCKHWGKREGWSGIFFKTYSGKEFQILCEPEGDGEIVMSQWGLGNLLAKIFQGEKCIV